MPATLLAFLQRVQHTLCGIKEGDRLIGYRKANTLDTLLSSRPEALMDMSLYELDDAKWKDVGSHISSAVKISADEKIVNAFVTNGFDSSLSLLTLSKNGMMNAPAQGI
ncbi:MAG: hypothetical protein V8T10_01900 [Merdibacter sp.]